MKNTTLKTLLAAPLLAFAVAAIVPAPTIAQSKKQDNGPLMYAEQMPMYEGGEIELMKFIGNSIHYPADAKANGLQGLVVLSFVVDESGKVKDAKVLKKLGHGTDEEALRVINLTSGKWTPGRQGGKIVPVQYTLPVRFTLSEAERTATATIANRMPQFKGGNEALHNTLLPYLKLPAEAKQENLNARMVVRFYVAEDGTVSNIRLEETKLKKTVGAGANMDYMDASTFQVQNKAVLSKLAEAATNAVKATSGKWEPALKDAQPVGSELVLPVQFLGEAANSQQMTTPVMTKYTKAYYTAEEVDVQPTFKDGSLDRFLAKNLRYPAGTDFEGTIEVGILVKADGKTIGPTFYFDPKDPSKIKEVDEELYRELDRVFKLMEGKWEPAKVDGKSVSVTKKLTILFITENGTKKKTDAPDKKADVIVTRYK
ncbi:MAG TPA: TonB family protein [Pontibacter sp.]